jgi:hypothetical protein
MMHAQNVINTAKHVRAVLEPVDWSCLGLEPDIGVGFAGFVSQFVHVVS